MHQPGAARRVDQGEKPPHLYLEARRPPALRKPPPIFCRVGQRCLNARRFPLPEGAAPFVLFRAHPAVGGPPRDRGYGADIPPAPATVSKGGFQTCSPPVTASSNQKVPWPIEEGSRGGQGSRGGTSPAPATAGTFHLIATSAADS